MVHYSEVAGHGLVLQQGPGRDVDPLPVVRNYNHCSLQDDIFSEGDVARHSKVVLRQL